MMDDHATDAAEPAAEQLLAVWQAARAYVAAVKQAEKGGVGRAWGQLVKAVQAAETTVAETTVAETGGSTAPRAE